MLTLLIALAAAAPTTFQQQGRLTDSLGDPINGPVLLTFSLYDVAEDGTHVWTESASPTLEDGYYSVQLGPLSETVLAEPSLWLEVSSGSGALLPRQPISASLYALNASSSNLAEAIIESPDGNSCVALTLGNGEAQLTSMPVDCTSGNPLSFESFNGAIRRVGGTYHTSCKAYIDDPVYNAEGSGNYWIDANSDGTPQKAYCDMVTDSGGWTLVALNTVDADNNLFYKTFAEYTAGWGTFDDVNGLAGWIGLETLHQLSNGNSTTLRAVTNTETYTYPNWSVGPASGDYVVSIPSSSHNPSNNLTGFRYAHGRAFSAWDRDNDIHSSNCAADRRSGWWYRDCWYTQLGDKATAQTYWNESTSPSDNFSILRLWLR